jgi:predicted nuclease of restriction endonuclease-like (RecB) superfamily
MLVSDTSFNDFVIDIKKKIRLHQYEALKVVNRELITLNWEIGKSIVEKQDALGWGKSVVKSLAEELQKEFVGMKGFSVQNLWNMRQFYLEYYKNEKLQPLVGEISWTKNVVIFQKCKDYLEREFLNEMGSDFAFLGNQYRLEVDDEEYFIDILLYHRRLKSLIAIELKIGKFKPEYAGKMNFYLSVLNDTIKLPDENPSIGIIICKEKKRTTVEYALKESNQPIGIATYKLTESLPNDLKGLLPTPSEIGQRLENLLQDIKETK